LLTTTTALPGLAGKACWYSRIFSETCTWERVVGIGECAWRVGSSEPAARVDRGAAGRGRRSVPVRTSGAAGLAVTLASVTNGSGGEAIAARRISAGGGIATSGCDIGGESEKMAAARNAAAPVVGSRMIPRR